MSDEARDAGVLRLVPAAERDAAADQARTEVDHAQVAFTLEQAAEFVRDTATHGIAVVLVHDDGTHSHLIWAGQNVIAPLLGAMDIAHAALRRSGE